MTGWFLLKVIHIFAAVLWMGGGVVLIFFIAPAVAATAPAGGAVMGHLVNKLKFPTVMAYAAWTTTLAGLAMFWHASNGMEPAYFQTLPGMGLAFGSISGILTFVGAVFVQLPRSKKIAALGAQAGGKPTAEQAAVLQGEQRKFALGGKIVVFLFVLSLLGMLASHPI